MDSIFKNKSFDEYSKDIFVTANKVGFVRKHIREGIIPIILHEYLNTRIMIKKSMQQPKYKGREIL